MIVTTNILMLPLITLVWAIDSYLFLMTLRLILGRLQMLETATGQSIVELAEQSRRAVERLLLNKLHVRPSKWRVWAALVGLILLIRTGLVLMLV